MGAGMFGCWHVWVLTCLDAGMSRCWHVWLLICLGAGMCGGWLVCVHVNKSGLPHYREDLQ